MREGGGIQVRSRGQICWMRWQRGEGAKETGIDNVKKKWFRSKTKYAASL